MHPTVAYIIGKTLGLDATRLSMLVLMCSMPTAKNLFIFAQQYQVGVARSNWVVFLTTVLSIFSIPFILHLIYLPYK